MNQGVDSISSDLNMYSLATELFPICRSITGNGVRQTLLRMKKELPELTINEVPTGTRVFDWTVPKEWSIKSAYIEDLDGNRIVDFNDNNLHIVGYSAPINKIVSLDELKGMVYTLPEQPDLIPYVTSYYKERSAFCMSHNQFLSLNKQEYRVVIDSELFDGSLSYGELLLKGETTQELFFSTYICHPSMANNELSGVCMTTALAKWIVATEKRHYSYRIIFIPETIGSITYLSQNLLHMKQNIRAGFNISCVGDERVFSYLESRTANTLADRVALHVLKNMQPEFIRYSYLMRGSDERQYNAPGVDLPVCSVMRSKYSEYPEYHTSADNLDLISENGLRGTLNIYKEMVTLLENNGYYLTKCLCEPQLGKRGLYPTESFKGSANHVKNMMNFIAYADGKTDLIDIADKIGVYANDLTLIAKSLIDNELVEFKYDSFL